MSLIALGSLLARRSAARSLRSSVLNRPPFHSHLQLQPPPSCFSSRSINKHPVFREVLINASIFAGSMLAGGGLAFAVNQFQKSTAAGKLTESEAWKKAGFELWILKNNKTYRDEEEKAMRFQLFKAAVETIGPERQLKMPPQISYFADFTEEERRGLLANPDRIDRTEMVMSAWAKQEERRAAGMDAQP